MCNPFPTRNVHVCTCMYVHAQLTMSCIYCMQMCNPFPTRNVHVYATYFIQCTYMYIHVHVCTCTTNYGMYILHANVQPFPNQKCTCICNFCQLCT